MPGGSGSSNIPGCAIRCDYADFWTVTSEALVFAARLAKLDLIKEKLDQRMNGFLELKAYPDVRVVDRKSRRVNLIDRDVNVHVVRVVMNDTHALMFSEAERLAKTLLSQAQRLSIGVFAGLERNDQMIGLR